ncbi:MAG TPA: PQQ-dependent sugar dehydrogenase, partial [Ramlibacter sp.]|uniref:PQQ-dependent sugar dehydrogenase n=1 Tax=Ramlibacter sp. TaxID=1917967 RepID=UPI002D7EBAF5
MKPATLLLTAMLAACGGGGGGDGGSGDPAPPPAQPLALATSVAVSGLDAPMFATAPAGDARLFIVERAGRIVVVQGGVKVAAPFLDISARVGTDGEGGLLSMAFDPAYALNGFFYVYFTETSGDIAIERFRVSAADANRADPAPLRILTIPHRSFSNHKGGLVRFGPDGFLYLATGDGGGGGDPLGNGQNLDSLLGK